MAVKLAVAVSSLIASTQGLTPRALRSLHRMLAKYNYNVDVYSISELDFPSHVRDQIHTVLDALVDVNTNRRNIGMPVAAAILLYDRYWNIVDMSLGFNELPRSERGRREKDPRNTR